MEILYFRTQALWHCPKGYHFPQHPYNIAISSTIPLHAAPPCGVAV